MGKALNDTLLSVRIAACDAVAALARAGYANSFNTCGHRSWHVLVPLTTMLQRESEPDEQLASAMALQALSKDGDSHTTAMLGHYQQSLAQANAVLSRHRRRDIHATQDPNSFTTVTYHCVEHLPQHQSQARRSRDETDSDDSEDESANSPPQRRNLQAWPNTKTRYLHVMGNPSAAMHNYSETLQSRLSDDECPRCVICQLKLTKQGPTKALPCGHVYHTRCIDAWLGSQRGGTCPLCRHRPSSARMKPHRLEVLPRVDAEVR